MAKTKTGAPRSGFQVAGLFAGIGGFELGLRAHGHQTRLMVEIDPAANSVLDQHFPGVARATDVRDIDSLPRGIDVIAAGFPCQDLSQAGRAVGIKGSRSGLVEEVFRLARKHSTPWIVLENVPFMLQLNRGEAIRYVVSELERMGYSWAYRKIDTRSFGLPQRRERIFLLAALKSDPSLLLYQDSVAPCPPNDHRGIACGFYWTEGTRGLGWAVDAVPTLKGGSSIGIPSAPAIWLPDGRICTPDLRDGERLQGFAPDWTKPAESVGRAGHRWKLIGNAVSVPAAEWLGSVLKREHGSEPPVVGPLPNDRSWPDAAFGRNGERWGVSSSPWPVARRAASLAAFLEYPLKPLSQKAAFGFYNRLISGSLRHPHEFRVALERHLGLPLANARGDRACAQLHLVS